MDPLEPWADTVLSFLLIAALFVLAWVVMP